MGSIDNDMRTVLDYIVKFTYNVKEVNENGITTGRTATLPIKYLIDYFVLEIPNIRHILRVLKKEKLITGYDFPFENQTSKVRSTTKGSMLSKITSNRRNMRRFIHWNDGKPSLENDYTFFPEYLREQIKKEEESKK